MNAILFTPLRASAAPVSPKPVTSWSTGLSPTISVNDSTSKLPVAGVYSLALYTTALPAASA